MKIYKDKALNQGSSLIEVLIATFIVGTILTAVAAGLTYSVKLNIASKQRSVATRLTQEGMEIFKRERVILGWDAFYSDMNNCSAVCIENISRSSFLPGDGICAAGGSCNGLFEFIVDNIGFEREAVIDISSGDHVVVTVTTTWEDPRLTKNHKVEISREFWEW